MGLVSSGGAAVTRRRPLEPVQPYARADRFCNIVPASIRDVALRAGVAVGTVSRVINDAPGVAADTRDRVEQAIRQLDYRPNRQARALSTGRTHTIGALVPFFTHPSAVTRLRGVVEALESSDYDLVLFNVGTATQRARHFGRTGVSDRVDGLLLVSLAPTDDEVAHFAAAEVACVLVDCDHALLPRVVTDDVEGGRLATQHLIDQGHRRIGFIGDGADPAGRFVASPRRRVGWARALAAAGLPAPPDLQRSGRHSEAEGRAAAASLLDLPEPPSAIFAASDTQALGVLDAAAERGLDVPGDLAVMGFDDLEVAAHVGLSTVRQPLHESGDLGARLLLAALDGALGDPEEVRLDLEVVPRRTTTHDVRSGA
jgi:LacI family transcriptional regulator